jgi:hypothetical protein
MHGTVLSDLARLFDKITSNAGLRIGYRSVAGNPDTGIIPREDKPETWQTIMMRLADGAGEASSWDYSDYYGKTTETTSNYNIKASALYGSANGANWELLDIAKDVTLRGKGQWAFDGRGVPNGHTNCNTIASRVLNVYPFLENMAGSVSVAQGATLVCKGAPIAFSKIRLDAAGAGTICGVAFAEDGEISIENVQTNDEIIFRGLFDGCTGEGNISGWTILINGNVNSRRSAQVCGGNLRIVGKGFCISLR